jgi:farnesyl-diphosphate farnesyltransferase
MEDLDRQVETVSRSFAMVINQLHEPLRKEVQVAYLLFRLGDNIEDTSSLAAEDKHSLLEGLLRAFREGQPYGQFLDAQGAAAWQDLTSDERALFTHTDAIIEQFGELSAEARRALLGEAEHMFRGMARVQHGRAGGYVILEDTTALEEYCYYVAGTVGDFLTSRFLAQLPGLDPARHAQLLGAGRSLALVLQVMNILRDVRDDHTHGHVFYPRSLFDRFDAPRLLSPEHQADVLRAGARMIRWLRPQVRLASAYILGLPARRPSLRLFCTIPYAMALKTIAAAVNNPAVFGEAPVKIPRSETVQTVLLARAAAPFDLALRAWFQKLWYDVDRQLR